MNFVRIGTLTAIVFLACKWDIFKKLLYIFICGSFLVKKTLLVILFLILWMDLIPGGYLDHIFYCCCW